MLRGLVKRRTLLFSVIFLLLDVLITLWLDYRPMTLIPVAVVSILINIVFVNKYKIRSFQYIALISGLISLVLGMIWAANPASDAEIIVIIGYYGYYFGLVGYTFGIASLLLRKGKLSIMLSWIGIIAASPAFLFATALRVFLG